MKKTHFHKYFPTKGTNLYWIIIAYLLIAFFYPIVGLLALICMIAPVAFSIRKGRWWCGNACPRGNMYDRLLARFSPHRPIPDFVRTTAFRIFMVCLIFTVFGIQMYYAWGDWNAAGRVFWNIILLTTVVGVILSFIYAPRTWCSFCPMGTLSSWVAPRKAPLPRGFRNITVSSYCNGKCLNCARVCPMQLTPHQSKTAKNGYLHPDCLKCRKCISACPGKIVTMQEH